MDQASDLQERHALPVRSKRDLRAHYADLALPAWLRVASWAVLILFALVLGDVAALRFHSSTLYHLDVGSWGDEALVDGMFAQETDALGVNYRWTSAHSGFHVHGFVAPARPLFQFKVGGLPANATVPRPVTVRSAVGTLVTIAVAAQPRRYQFVLPAAALANGNADITFTSTTSTVQPDPRAIGFRLDDIAVGWNAGQWAFPTWLIVLVQWSTVLVWLCIAWRLGVSRLCWPILVAALVTLLPLMTVAQLLVATVWQIRLLLSSLVICGLAWHALALLARLAPAVRSSRERIWLCSLTAIIVVVQLFPVFYPLFGSHDLYIHMRRLQDVQLGTLKLFDTPSEFAGRKTIVPSAFYALASPLTLLTATPGPAIQGLYTFIQGSSSLLLALLVRHIGGSSRAALLAALIIGCLPIQVTILWWGFGPQIAGQWLLLLVAVFASHTPSGRRPFWMAAGAALSLAFLMHDGVAILGGVWLGLFVLLLVMQRRSPKLWTQWAVLLAVCTLIATLLMYSDVVALQLSGLAEAVRTPHTTDEHTRLVFFVDGLVTGLQPLGLVLAVFCLGAVVWRMHGAQRALVTSWVASGVIFLLIDMVLGLQVRYTYFLIPVVCAGLGMLLDRMMERRPWGWITGWCVVGVIGYSGVTLLYGSILWGFKPLLSALTH